MQELIPDELAASGAITRNVKAEASSTVRAAKRSFCAAVWRSGQKVMTVASGDMASTRLQPLTLLKTS